MAHVLHADRDGRRHADRVVLRCLLTPGAGISLLAGQGGGLYLLAFAFLLGIALQVSAAWTLLVEAGQHTHANQRTHLPDIVSGPEHQAEPPSAGQRS